MNGHGREIFFPELHERREGRPSCRLQKKSWRQFESWNPEKQGGVLPGNAGVGEAVEVLEGVQFNARKLKLQLPERQQFLVPIPLGGHSKGNPFHISLRKAPGRLAVSANHGHGTAGSLQVPPALGTQNGQEGEGGRRSFGEKEFLYLKGRTVIKGAVQKGIPDLAIFLVNGSVDQGESFANERLV